MFAYYLLMRILIIILFTSLHGACLRAQVPSGPYFPADSFICSCTRADIDCGTAGNVKLCYRVVPDWPDSLLHETYFEYFAYPFDWEKNKTDTTRLVKAKEKRYTFYSNCPDSETGIFDLGAAGKMKFTKIDGWVNCEWFEKGNIGDFIFEISNCDVPEKSVELDVNDYQIHWFGKQRKQAVPKQE